MCLVSTIFATVASSHSDRSPNGRIPLVIDFHPSLPDITGILRQYHHLLQQSETMKHVASQIPLVTFRRPQNLKNFLVRGKLGSYSHPQAEVGPCNRSRCQVCMFVDSGTTVTSCPTNKSLVTHVAWFTFSPANYVIFSMWVRHRLNFVYVSTITEAVFAISPIPQ